MLWADGRRSFPLPHNARIEVSRHPEPVSFARLRDAPFTDRLVAKFALPDPGVARIGDGAPVIHELRITGLGVIAEATCRFAPGFTAVTG